MAYKLLYLHENAHEDAIWSVSWCKNENTNVEHIMTGSLDDTVKVWKKDNFEIKLEEQYIFEGHALGVISVDINSTGTLAASNSLDSHIRLWDLNTGDQVQAIDAGPLNSWTVVFSPDSDFLATCSQSGKILFFSSVTGEKLGKELDSNGKFTVCIAIRKDGKQLAGGSIDGMIRLYDIETGTITTTLEGHAMPIRSIAFSDDGKYLITGSDDCHVKVYEVQTGELISTLSGHGSWVLSVKFSPDNKHFVSSSADKTVKIWNMDSRECEHTFTDHKEQVWGVAYNPDGTQLASVSEDKSVAIYSCA